MSQLHFSRYSYSSTTACTDIRKLVWLNCLATGRFTCLGLHVCQASDMLPAGQQHDVLTGAAPRATPLAACSLLQEALYILI